MRSSALSQLRDTGAWMTTQLPPATWKVRIWVSR
jgi:hypothetical protein